MKNIADDNFKFFIPLDINSIIKGGEKNEKGDMFLTGIASTLDRDTDGEILDPNGFDLTQLMERGFINWHHKDDPNYYIGEPVEAFIKDNKLHVKARLWGFSELAKSVYDMAVGLVKSGSSRRLGWSIEGKAIEKDTINPKIIKKAKITGIAITPIPKNASTFVDIIKGEKTGYEEELYDIVENSVIINESKTPLLNSYILDILKPNGDRILVDVDFNIKIEAGALTNMTQIEKSLDTSTGAALMKESVEGSPKKLVIMTEDIKKGLQNLILLHDKGNLKDIDIATFKIEVLKI